MIQPFIEVILSDLGNVILPFNHYQIPEKLARYSTDKDQADPSKIFSYLFNLHTGTVKDYETGRLSSMEFFQSVKDSFNLRISFEEQACHLVPSQRGYCSVRTASLEA